MQNFKFRSRNIIFKPLSLILILFFRFENIIKLKPKACEASNLDHASTCFVQVPKQVKGLQDFKFC